MNSVIFKDSAKSAIFDQSKNSSQSKLKVLISGATGNIGKYITEKLKDRYELTLMLHSDKKKHEVEQYGKVVISELSDLQKLENLFKGIDVIVHLAGMSSPSTSWKDVCTYFANSNNKALDANIVGTYNVFLAAKNAGVKRVIYASSIHAISGYPAHVQVRESDPVNPGDIYGVSKCFSESLARYMATQQGLSIICLRIGAFQGPENVEDPDKSLWMMNAWISPRDMTQLIVKCIDNTLIHFGIFHALSGNRFNRMDISLAKELLGYQPEDDFVETHPVLKKLHLNEKVKAHSETASGYESGLKKEQS